jgi:HEAT repeat protein
MLDQLLDRLNGSDDGKCEAAAVALGEMGEAALPHVTLVLANGSADTRFWAVRALWAMGTPAAIEVLISALNDPDEMVRSGAALALGELRAEVAIEKLAWLMREEVGSTGIHAADALSKIGKPGAGVLIDALGAARPWVRMRAARALVPIKSPDAIPALFQALDDDSYIVRHYAEEALARMGIGQMVYFSGA